MANQFLVEIHNHISRLIEIGAQEAADARTRDDHGRTAFMAGKIDELKKIRLFLSDHFDLTTQKYY
jgi:hypothetical protein